MFIIFCLHSNHCPTSGKGKTVHCGIAPPARVRLLETKGRHFSEFAIFYFLSSTTNTTIVVVVVVVVVVIIIIIIMIIDVC
jgi:hypothetical protein